MGDLPAELLTTAIDQAAAPIVIADGLGRISYVNTAACELLGTTVVRLRGRHFSSLLGDSEQRNAFEVIGARVASGQRWSGPVQGRRRDGALIQIDLAVAPVRDEAGAVTHSIALMRDISGERGIAGVLSGELAQQAAVGAALSNLDPSDPIAVLAGDVASALLALDGVDFSRVVGFGAREQAEVLADRAVGPALPRQLAVPSARTRHLRTRASEGAWVEGWIARRDYGRYGRELRAAGIRAAGYAPLRHAGRTVGVLAVATVDPRGLVVLERHLTALSHFGALASGILGPGLAARQHDADLRAEIERLIRERAFSPTFQPIVRLGDREAIAYEALSRFHDGSPPERQFADAEAIGLGVDLEMATLRAVGEAAEALPAGVTLTVNVSPTLVTQSGSLKAFLAEMSRPMVLEITEREPIDDYEAFRTAVEGLDVAVGWAVDDAGAGYASLRHIIELRPDYVKLDRELVHTVNSDPIRQALVAGMLHFAGSIGLRLIAEGVETEAERLTLQALGLELGQGYLFGRPAPAPDAAAPVRGG